MLGVDTCGPSGSVALARIGPGSERDPWADRTGGAQLFGHAGGGGCATCWSIRLAQRDLGAIVVVNGPGSFTGVRVGLSAVKGLAEPAGIPVVAVSRLEVLAPKAGVRSAALDAHRHEVFLRAGIAVRWCARLLAGQDRLCDDHPFAGANCGLRRGGARC